MVFLFSKAPLAFRNAEIMGEQKLIFFFFIINFHLKHASLACIFRIYGSVAIGSNSETTFSTLFKCSFDTVISLLLYVRWIVYHTLSIAENSSFFNSFSGIFHTSFTTSLIAFKAFENSSKLFFRSLF